MSRKPIDVAKFDEIVSEFSFKPSYTAREAFDFALDYGYGDNIPVELNERHVKQLMVNNIRHKGTNYNKQVYRLGSAMGHYQPRYRMYKNIVLRRIAEEYPFLEDECKRQIRRVDMVHIVEG